MLAVDDENRGERGVEIIRETRVDVDGSLAAGPLSIGFDGRAVAERGATTMSAKRVRYRLVCHRSACRRYPASSAGCGVE